MGEFLLRYINTPRDQLARVLKSRPQALESGYKDNMESISDYISDQTYPDATDFQKPFVKNLSWYGYDREDIEEFFNNLNVSDESNISPGEFSVGGFTFKILEKDDPTGVILGDMTSCCQVLDGQAEEAVYDGYNNPMSGFLAVYNDKGTLVAQSWLRLGRSNTLYLDNIETITSYDENEKLRQSFISFSKQLKEERKYEGIISGSGYSDITFGEDIPRVGVESFASEFGSEESNYYSDLEGDDYKLAKRFNLSKFGKNFLWYKIATKEDLQKYFNQAFFSIKKSIEMRQKKGIEIDPGKILSQKVNKYKKLLRNEFNILLDQFSNDPDNDMEWFIDNYNQISHFETETVYRNPLLETNISHEDEELFHFFASGLVDADPNIINWAVEKSKDHLKSYADGNNKESELKEILNYIQAFIDTRDKLEIRNINDIENFLHLKKMISGGTLQNEIIDPKVKGLFEIEDPPSPEDIKFNGHFYELYHGTTLSDYAYLGKGTRWCFRCDKNNDPDLGVAMSYLGGGDIWVIFRDGKPFRAVNLLTSHGGMAGGDIEYMDSSDNEVDIEELKTKFSDFYEKIKKSSIDFAQYENPVGLLDLISNGTITKNDDEFIGIIEDIIGESYSDYFDEDIKQHILVNKIVVREDGDIFYSLLSKCIEESEIDDIIEFLNREIIIPEDDEMFRKAIEKISDDENDFLRNILKYGGIDRNDLFWGQLVDEIIDNSSYETIESFISQGIISPENWDGETIINRDNNRFWKAINYLYEKIGDSERWYHFVTNVLYGKNILTETDLVNRGYQVPVENMPFEVDDSEDLNPEIFGSRAFFWYKRAANG